jgi:hypothetical protein
MDHLITHHAPRDAADALDARVCDLASGAVSDARSAQNDARFMLADYERAHPGSLATAGRNSPMHSRTV